MADVVLNHLRVRLPINLLSHPSTETIAKIGQTLDETGLQPEARALGKILSCIKCATIKPGQIDIELDRQNTADCLGIAATELNVQALTFTTPFQLRKRGVETKLVIGAAPLKAVDATLIRSIAKAHQYYEAIKQGQTIEEIAVSENLTKRRILQVIDLAFLAPDIIRSIAHGDQPVGLTAKWLGLNLMPSDWQAQRRIAATL